MVAKSALRVRAGTTEEMTARRTLSSAYGFLRASLQVADGACRSGSDLMLWWWRWRRTRNKLGAWLENSRSWRVRKAIECHYTSCFLWRQPSWGSWSRLRHHLGHPGRLGRSSPWSRGRGRLVPNQTSCTLYRSATQQVRECGQFVMGRFRYPRRCVIDHWLS